MPMMDNSLIWLFLYERTLDREVTEIECYGFGIFSDCKPAHTYPKVSCTDSSLAPQFLIATGRERQSLRKSHI